MLLSDQKPFLLPHFHVIFSNTERNFPDTDSHWRERDSTNTPLQLELKRSSLTCDEGKCEKIDRRNERRLCWFFPFADIFQTFRIFACALDPSGIRFEFFQKTQNWAFCWFHSTMIVDRAVQVQHSLSLNLFTPGKTWKFVRRKKLNPEISINAYASLEVILVFYNQSLKWSNRNAWVPNLLEVICSFSENERWALHKHERFSMCAKSGKAGMNVITEKFDLNL